MGYPTEQKNDFRDAEAIAEAVQRPTMKFVATKTAEQLDLQALHRLRERLVSERSGIINQIRAFLLDRGIAVRQGFWYLRAALLGILATPSEDLSARMVSVIEDWPRTGVGSMIVSKDCQRRSKLSLATTQAASV
jgi:transposase